MGWLQDTKRWIDDRYRLIQLHHEISHISAMFDDDLKRAHLPGMPLEGPNMIYAQIDNETRFLSDEYDRIVTDRMLRRAAKYGVPIPAHRQNSPYWAWSDYERRELLTVEGLALLRREIAQERETLHKPWLSWGAFAISIAGLLISIIALSKA